MAAAHVLGEVGTGVWEEVLAESVVLAAAKAEVVGEVETDAGEVETAAGEVGTGGGEEALVAAVMAAAGMEPLA